MQENDLHRAIMQSESELRRHKINLGSPSRIAFDMNNTMTSCPAVMLLPTQMGTINIPNYQMLRAIHADPRIPNTTIEDLWKCTQEHYGLTAATLITGAAGIPISKISVGAWVHVGSSKNDQPDKLYRYAILPSDADQATDIGQNGQGNLWYGSSIWHYWTRYSLCRCRLGCL